MSGGYRIGDRLCWPDRPEAPWGEVVAYQDLGDGRQVLRVMDDAGALHAVAVCPGSQVLAGPVDLTAAQAIARQVLAGQAVRLPEAQQMNLLASAVLMLGGTRSPA